MRRGIGAFSVNRKDATEHVALSNGAAYHKPDHDTYATYLNAGDPKNPTI